MSRPFVSVCMIVKNEERTLLRCLESLVGVHDELIIVDTGSRDQTVEIAKDFGARVEPFEWADDFAAARNHACSYASGEWIFMVDGDEFLSPKGSGTRLVGLLERVPDRIDKLLIEQRTVFEGESIVSVMVDRIYRNRPDLRWKYRIHEVIETPKERTAMTNDVYLRHEPAAKRRGDMRVSEEREAMYLRALALDIEEHANDPRPSFYLASTLYGAGRYEEARDAYERYFDLSEGQEPARRAVAFRDASIVAGALDDSLRRRSLLFQSMESDWRSGETYVALADLALEHENRSEAIHWLTVAAACEPSVSETHISSAARRETVWSRLATIYREVGDLEQARLCETEARSHAKSPERKAPRRVPGRKKRGRRRR